MSNFVCMICDDLLMEPRVFAPGKDKNDYHPVTIRCGHMFHMHCLIVSKNEEGDPNWRFGCPICSTRIFANDIRKIFFSNDDEFLDYYSLLAKVDERNSEVEIHTERLEKFRNDLIAAAQNIPATHKMVNDQAKVIEKLQREITLLKNEEAEQHPLEIVQDEIKQLREILEEQKKLEIKEIGKGRNYTVCADSLFLKVTKSKEIARSEENRLEGGHQAPENAQGKYKNPHSLLEVIKKVLMDNEIDGEEDADEDGNNDAVSSI